MRAKKIHFWNGKTLVCGILKLAERMVFDTWDSSDPNEVTCDACRGKLRTKRKTRARG